MFLEFFYLLRARGLDVSINEWMTLVEALDKGTKPEVDGESASKAVEIICAAYESAKKGHPVKL